MRISCNVCQRNESVATTWLPIFGNVCLECEEKLYKPTHRTGCVTSGPLAELAWLYVAEFQRRRDLLLDQAREVCK